MPEFPKGTRAVLAVLRFVLISLLSFFLLNPMLKTIFKEVEKPVLIFAQDNSISVLSGKDSSFYRGEYKENLKRVMDELSDKFDVKAFSFGEKISNEISFDFVEKQTDISEMIEEIYTLFGNRNIGAMFLASDGIYNKGANPVYASAEIKAPVYTIALGDTAVKRDQILKNVRYNRIAYLGNMFPLELIIEARELEGRVARVKITKGDVPLFLKEIEITSNFLSLSVPVELEATQKGIQRYSISLSPLDGEANFANNVFEVFIDVLDSRQKILVVASSPHPDIRAIRETIELSENYEADVFLLNDLKLSSIKNYNLVILHKLPSVKNTVVSLLQTISLEKIPVLFILGSETDLNSFNNLQTGVNITGSRDKISESMPVLNKNFVLFSLSEEAINYVKNFPPLQSPFGTYKMSPSVQVLFYQKIGMVETGQPLVFFNSFSEKKNGVIAGEGLWRWRLNDFARNGDHRIFSEFVLKAVQYLSLKENRNKFRISGKNNFQENEQLVFDAELYNESFELVNEPEVNFEIINEEGKKFPFVFSKTERTYHLNAGLFPVGNYKYEALSRIGETLLSAKGEFSVSAIQVESANTIADHQLLFNLARKHNGEMLFPDQLLEIPGILEMRDDLVSVAFIRKNLSDFINVKWIFALLLTLVSLEWFIRKRSGFY